MTDSIKDKQKEEGAEGTGTSSPQILEYGGADFSEDQTMVDEVGVSSILFFNF